MMLFKLISLSSVILLTACTSTGDSASDNEKTKEVAVPSSWSTQVANTIPGPERWIESFNDPVMLKLIDEGKANNHDLQAAALNMDKAWLLAKQSGAALKPTVDLSLSGSSAGTGSSSSSTSAATVGLQTSWEIDVWGRIQSGIDAASSRAESAEADYIFAEHSLSANIAKTYLKVIDTKIQADITQENLDILEKTLLITKGKYDNGFSSAQDLALNKANLAAAQDQFIATKGAQRDAIRALEVLIGRYPNAQLDTPNVLPELPASPPADIPSSVLERRPDIIAAERQIAASFNALSQAKTAGLPSFALTNNINGASSSLSDMLNPSNVAWQLGVNLLAPIFDGGRQEINVEIATIEQEQALSNYRQKALTAFAEVEDNLDLEQVLAKREVALAEAYKQSNKAYGIAELRYQEGESELLDTLQIQQQVISAKSNLMSIKRKQLEQRVNLYLSLGGSW